MSPRYYKLTILGCALSWLLVGLHVPALHSLTHQDRAPSWLALSLLGAFVVMGVAELWILLRQPAAGPRASAIRSDAP